MVHFVHFLLSYPAHLDCISPCTKTPSTHLATRIFHSNIHSHSGDDFVIDSYSLRVKSYYQVNSFINKYMLDFNIFAH